MGMQSKHAALIFGTAWSHLSPGGRLLGIWVSKRGAAIFFKAVLLLVMLLLVALPVLAADADSKQSGETKPTAGKAQEESYPVELDGEVVFQVWTGIGPIAAEERAQLAQKRLLRFANDPFYSPELIRLVAEGQEMRLYYQNELVGTFSQQDAAAEGLTLEDAAVRTVNRIKQAIYAYRSRRTPRQLLRAGLMLTGATLVAGFMVVLLNKYYLKILARVEQTESRFTRKFMRPLGLPPKKVQEYRRRSYRWSRNLLVLLVVLIWLEEAFNFFPITRGYARSVVRYLFEPVAVLFRSALEHVGDLFFILVVVALTYYLLKVLRWLARGARAETVTVPGVAPEFAMPLYKIVRLVVIAFSAVVIYPYIPGSSSAAFKGVSLFVGAVFTLGASGTAGNFIGGVVVVFMGHYRLGDLIRVGDVTGDVIEVSLLVTRVRTLKNEMVSIPNSSIISGQLINYSARAKKEGLILHTSVTIGYDAPWRQVHELLLAAARKTKGLLEIPAPFVLQSGLNDFYVAYELNVYTRQASEMLNLYSELHQHIQDEFNRAGVQIMSPHYFGDPDEPKLVPPERWIPTNRPGAPGA